MRVVFRCKAWRFFFFSNEGSLQEPLRIHVRRGACVAKIRLQPYTCVEDSYGFNPAELREILGVAEENRERIERAWDEHFNL